MIRKMAKSSNLKQTSNKKNISKPKEGQLSNGHADSESEQTENTTEMETKCVTKITQKNTELPRSSRRKGVAAEAQETTSMAVDEQQEPPAESGALTEMAETVPNPSRKRKIPVLPKKKMEMTKTEKMSTGKDSTNEAKSTKINEAEQQEPEKDTSENPSSVPKTSHKRKIPPKEIKREKKTVAKTKTKKQKVLLEVPKINSILGKVFVIGENDVGQLGLGEDIPQKTRPALLDLPYSIVDIAAGGMHSVCLTESGEVITFGCNDEGALGRVTSEEGSEYIPGKVDIPERIVQISAGDSHSAAVSDCGQVYIWGNFRNVNGPMGLVAEGAYQSSPVRILDGVTVVKVASGSDHLVCLSQEGTVYTCGCADAGQLGRVSEYSSMDGGRRGRISLLTPDKVPITRSNKVLQVNNIWTGSYATYTNVLESDLIYAFGLNNFNQLGFESQTTIMKPKQVSSFNHKHWLQIIGGQHHTVALDNRGLVHSLGRDDYGRLGLGENCGIKIVPTEIPTLQDEKCVDISCGNIVSFAVTDSGSVFSWGMGTNNQLGHGNDDDQHIPRQVEGNFLNSWKALKISGGGQHTLILASPRECSGKSQ